MLSISLGSALLLAVAAASPQQPSAPCSGGTYALLDFWIGEWDVHLAGKETEPRIGTNVIEKSLGGCGIFEHWRDAFDSAGKSLFYYHPSSATWKQVWVTDNGRVKEKRVVASPSPAAVRFQGEIRLPDGSVLLDRTTLTPIEGGRVRQHIEQSKDNGATWESTFDAIYSRSADMRATLVEARRRAYAANVRNDQAGLRSAIADFERLSAKPGGAWARYYAAWSEWALSASQAQAGDVAGAVASLDSVVARLRAAVAEHGDSVEFQVMFANALISLVSLDRARFPALASEIRDARRRALELGPANPRVVLMDAGLIFNNPPERGGGQEKGIERWQEALRLFEEEAAAPRVPGPEPRWGRDLAYGWFAQILMRATPPRRAEADAAARRALELRPDFWYVTHVILPMLRTP